MPADGFNLSAGSLLGLPVRPQARPERRNALSGQDRTAWLNEQAVAAQNALNYYLGPAAAPVNALVQGAQYTDAGDYIQAGQASREVWNDPTLENVLDLATAGAAMALPMYSYRMGEDMAQAVNRFGADESGSVGPGRDGITAYHGSPHDFDRFSMDKIGTGEGAQAYGHGLYFAENEGVARAYRDALQFPRIENPKNAVERVVDDLNYHRGNVDGVRAIYQSMIDRGTTEAQELAREKLAALPKVLEQFKGRMYEVNINANPDDFLDWDGEITSAPPAFQDWVKRRMDEVDLKEGSRAQRQLQNWRAAPGDWQAGEGVNVPPPRVAEVRNWLGDYGENQASMTDAMREAGIPGIKYRDAGSRGADAESGTRNYVVFDENLISIVRKYGIAGAAAMLGVSAMDVEAAMAEGAN
jgi:hypothetical protein